MDLDQNLSDSKLFELMNECINSDDTEVAHGIADELLTIKLRQLGYGDLCDLYARVHKWYA